MQNLFPLMSPRPHKQEPPAEHEPCPELTGCKPGLLDEEQPLRLLRFPHSILSFASFDPDIAAPHGISRLSNLSLNDDDHCRPKRIVIETIPGSGSFWRWVPRARKSDHAIDEGSFPRPVYICGKKYIISQDQWDIYKLDPLYDCFVDDFCYYSVISRKNPSTYERFNAPSAPSSWGGLTESQASTSEIPISNEDDDRMIVDDDNTPFNLETTPKRQSRPKRRLPSDHINFTDAASPSCEKSKPKRTADVSFQTLRDPGEEENAYFKADSRNRNTRLYAPKEQKRARTMSPNSSNRERNNQKTKREKEKQARREEEKEARRRHRDQSLLREVLSEVPQYHFQENRSHQFYDIPEEREPEEAEMGDFSHVPYSTEDPGADTEAQRIARLEESVRKMAQLNADRERQRQREQLYRGEELGRRAKTEVPRPKQEERARWQAEEEEGRRQDEARRHQEVARQQEARQRRADLMERLESERQSRHGQWESGLWSNLRAVERYKTISAFFDKAKFSDETLPLTFIDIPWPTLRRPSEITAPDMDWEAVTDFFNTAKETIRGPKYKEFMKISFQRFHPDRWTSRNLYNAITSEVVRNEVMTAVSTVSKAVGALFEEAKTSS